MAAACKSCHAPVIWCVTESGKAMPVDAVALVDGGNILIDYSTVPPVARVMKKGEIASGPRHVSHFGTCRFAAAHRKQPA